jgi:CheY-like chemotaxis protein
VQAFEAGAFDMVLMDCQMPVMDGLRATRAIRAIEQQRNAPRIPIVAVTANAFAEDRDACLDAGMDGYLSKPFNSAQLDGILQRWLPAHLVVERRGQPQRQTERPDVDLPDIDPIVLEPMKRQRADFYRRLIKTFLQHSPRLVEGLAQAATQEDHAAIKIAAHSLKSSSANVGASRLSAIARDLETSAMHIDAVTAGARVRELAEVFARVKAHFEAELSRTTASEIAPITRVSTGTGRTEGLGGQRR